MTEAKPSAADVYAAFLAQTAHLQLSPARHYALAVLWAHKGYRKHRVALWDLITVALEAYADRKSREEVRHDA
jgi:hypothetical protein